MNDRPVFYYNELTENEIKAGGVILYRKDKEHKTIKFLLINSQEKYEDFGGRTDVIDKNINETIAREVEEESNGLIKKEYIINNIEKYLTDKKRNNPEDDLENEFMTFIGQSNLIKEIYIKNSKYLLYFIPTDIDYDTTKFGTYEIHDNIARTVDWITYEKLISMNNLNFRLRNRQFRQTIEEIYKLTIY